MTASKPLTAAPPPGTRRGPLSSSASADGVRSAKSSSITHPGHGDADFIAPLLTVLQPGGSSLLLAAQSPGLAPMAMFGALFADTFVHNDEDDQQRLHHDMSAGNLHSSSLVYGNLVQSGSSHSATLEVPSANRLFNENNGVSVSANTSANGNAGPYRDRLTSLINAIASPPTAPMSALGAAALDIQHDQQLSPPSFRQQDQGSHKKTSYSSRKRKISYLSIENPLLPPSRDETDSSYILSKSPSLLPKHFARNVSGHYLTNDTAQECTTTQMKSLDDIKPIHSGANTDMPSAIDRLSLTSSGDLSSVKLKRGAGDFTIPDPSTFFNNLFDEASSSHQGTISPHKVSYLCNDSKYSDKLFHRTSRLQSDTLVYPSPTHPALAALHICYPIKPIPSTVPIYMTTIDDIQVYVCELSQSAVTDEEDEHELMNLSTISSYTPSLSDLTHSSISSTLRARKNSRNISTNDTRTLSLSSLPLPSSSSDFTSKTPRSPRYSDDTTDTIAPRGVRNLPLLRSGDLHENISSKKPRACTPAKDTITTYATQVTSIPQEVENIKLRLANIVKSPRQRRFSANSMEDVTTVDLIPPPKTYLLVRRADTPYVNATTLLEAGGVATEAERSIVLSLERSRIKVRGRKGKCDRLKERNGMNDDTELTLDGTWIPLPRARAFALTCAFNLKLSVFLSDNLPEYFPSVIIANHQQYFTPLHQDNSLEMDMDIDTDIDIEGDSDIEATFNALIMNPAVKLTRRKRGDHRQRGRLRTRDQLYENSINMENMLMNRDLSPSTAPSVGIKITRNPSTAKVKSSHSRALHNTGIFTTTKIVHGDIQKNYGDVSPHISQPLRMPPSGSFSSALPTTGLLSSSISLQQLKRSRRNPRPRVVGVPDPQSFFADAHARKQRKKEEEQQQKRRRKKGGTVLQECSDVQQEDLRKQNSDKMDSYHSVVTNKIGSISSTTSGNIPIIKPPNALIPLPSSQVISAITTTVNRDSDETESEAEQEEERAIYGSDSIVRGRINEVARGKSFPKNMV